MNRRYLYARPGAGYAVGLYICAALSSGRASAYKQFCDDPGFVMRAAAPMPEENLLSLLTKEERADPGAFNRLFSAKGPYGHNELGFRYLARAFGYPGQSWGRKVVERWLAERELRDSEFKGTWELWVKWVREPKVVLRTAERPAARKLASYFQDPVDAITYSGCVSGEIARMRCENYLGKELKAGARVYYAQSELRRQPCRVHFNGGDLREEAPDKIEVPVGQYYLTNSRGLDALGQGAAVKATGIKTFDIRGSFTGQDDKSSAQPAK